MVVPPRSENPFFDINEVSLYYCFACVLGKRFMRIVRCRRNTKTDTLPDTFKVSVQVQPAPVAELPQPVSPMAAARDWLPP
jgi:hypothetical protein